MEVIKNQCLFLAFAVRHMVEARGKTCKIGFVGCGQVGTFVLESLVKEGWQMDNVLVCTRSGAATAGVGGQQNVKAQLHFSCHPLDQVFLPCLSIIQEQLYCAQAFP
jgi:malic enzyme